VEVFGAPRRSEPAALRPGRYEAPPPLTLEQARAWEPLAAALARGAFAPFLLHGVTGSGKTELYLRAAAATLRAGRQVLILVPEIALASQIVARFANRFPGAVAVLHSALRDAERYAQWELVRTGERPIVIGPRSALFAPLPDPGLLVLDEEHEASYKQEAPPPRYDARAVARELARLAGATLILGSATPDVGTRHAAESGELRLLELRGRVGPARGGGPATLELPAVEAVDMRQELREGHTAIFSRPLIALLRRTLAAGEQSILFLNRRGTATIVQCRVCGHVMHCPRCEIPLVYHADREALLCHRCNGREPRPRTCPTCGAGPAEISYYGAGTQRVEREVRALLPRARVLRWDQDALSARVDATALLAKVQAHEVDVVVGTQMVAKGLDLPLVTAIGVINADTLLNLPDFRAGERTFQLLTQVAGRAGRRGPGSRVIVQSYTPEHYAIQAALTHDYADFYREELDFRRRHRYPPFSRLARFVYRHADEAVCALEGERFARAVAAAALAAGLEDLDIMGPTPCFAAKARDLYQWQLVVRSGELDALLRDLRIPPAWQVDVDPLSLL
jgi:primosomal protein N' (replication factor Y)